MGTVHKMIALVVALLLGADVARATSPWPATAPPRAPTEPLTCAGRGETVLDAQQRALRLERELGALRNEETDGGSSWSGELANEDSDEDALVEQLAAAHELIAWANSSSFTCAVGCRHTDDDTCVACPATYDACSAFGGCDPNGAALNVTEDDVACTCLESFTGRRCSGKELGSVATFGLVAFSITIVGSLFMFFSFFDDGEFGKYPECTGEANSWSERTSGYLTKLTKILVVLQLNEPPFSPDEQFAVDYGLPEIPPWLSAISFDFAELEGWDWKVQFWKVQFWLFNGIVVVVMVVVIGCSCVCGGDGPEQLRLQLLLKFITPVISLLIIPFVRVTYSFWLECTAFDGTNEMRWQIAALNATETNITEDGLFFEMTEEDLYGTSVSAQFFDQAPAESCRESSMLTYGLAAIPFFWCGIPFFAFVHFKHDKMGGAYKPLTLYNTVYLIFKIISALLVTALGEWHRKVTSFYIVVLNLILVGIILKITPYDPAKYNDMNRLELWGAVETVITYMSTLFAYWIDDPSRRVSFVQNIDFLKDLHVAAVLWLVASCVAIVCFIAAEVALGPKEKKERREKERMARRLSYL